MTDVRYFDQADCLLKTSAPWFTSV